MLRYFFLAGLFGVAPASSSAQAAPQPVAPAASAPALPDSTYFRFFFLHVAGLQNAADTLKAQGKADMPMRNLLKNKAQLTNQEFAIVVSAAQGCNAAYAAESKSGAATARQIGQQYPGASALPPGAVQQIAALEAQRTQVIANCMANLQSQMGTPRYQVLRDFVVTSEAPNLGPAAHAAQGPAGKTPQVQSAPQN